MSTRIGICTRYDRNECSYVATILADWLEQRGFDVSMLVIPVSPIVRQGASWDTRQHDGKRVLFSDWSPHRDIVIWTVIPQPVQLQYLRDRGIKSFILYDPYDPKTAELLAAYKYADAVLAVNRSCGERCAIDPKVTRAVYLPLVPVAPVYKPRPINVGQLPTIAWPIYDGDWMRFDRMDLLTRMSKFLAATAGTFNLRIVLSSSDIPAMAVRVMQIWNKRYDFVTLQTCRSVCWRDMQYHGADVMFWPSTIENAMLRGLHAYSYGVPIIGVMANPMSELLAVNPHMAAAVPKADCDRHGYADGVSSEIIHPTILSRLLGIVQSPAMLAEAGENVGRFMVARQKLFSAAMTKLFK